MRGKPRSVFPVLALLAVVAAPVAAQVYVDYDPEYHEKIQTFAWRESDDTSLAQVDPMLHSRIVERVNQYLADQGYRQVESDPDIFVTYHTKSKEELQLNTTSYGYGYPGAWTWDPYWPGYWGAGFSGSTTTVTSYTRGTLILDVWDAATKKLVWRGSASEVLSRNPRKVAKQVDTALLKMIKKWEDLKKKAAKRRNP